jgi:hypothetical protein
MLKKPYEIFSYVKKAHDLPSVAEFLRQCLDAVHKFLMFAYAVESLSIDTVEARVKEALARRSRDSDSVREIGAGSSIFGSNASMQAYRPVD